MNERIADCERKLNDISLKVDQLRSQCTQECVSTVVRQSLLGVLTDINKTKTSPTQNVYKAGKTRLKWTFNDFKEAIKLESDGKVFWHESPTFYSHENGYRFQAMIKFLAEGVDNVYVAAAIQIIRGEYDSELKWPLSRMSLVFIIDGPQGTRCCKVIETREDNPHEFAATRRPRGIKNPPFWRERQIISRAELEEKFVQNNMLTVRVEIDMDSLAINSAKDPYGTLFNGKLEVFQESPASILLRSCIVPSTTFEPVCFCYHQSLNPTANYFEVEIISQCSKNGSIGIGVGPTDLSGQPQMPGWLPESYGYHSDDGQVFEGAGRGKPFGPVCCPGDIIGCGIHFSSSLDNEKSQSVQLFFTHNGLRVGTVIDLKNTTKPLYPMVGVIHLPSAARFSTPYLRPLSDFSR